MAKKLWGGRFKKEIDKDFFEFQKSINYDHKLAEYDINHSFIHLLALKYAGILTKKEWQSMDKALRDIAKEVKSGIFGFDPSSEDIHTEIQNRLEKKIPAKAALKLHSLRSRNDQVVFDEKYYCHVESGAVAALLSNVSDALLSLSAKYKGVYIAGYTHTQRAQKVSLNDYLCAFVSMLGKDEKRLADFKKKLIIYIGSGAFKGTSLTSHYAKAIKQFSGVFKNINIADNPLDNVSDRDFIVEFLSAISIIQMHLSRLAEDFILYSTKEFGYFDLPEEFCTGSSLMPHKKNPDFLELIRGNTGKVYGNLVSLLTMMKGLPLTYNRDMQLDKEPMFSSVDTIKSELKILARFIKGVKLNKDAIGKSLEDESLYATELAEYLVWEKVPFKEAHNIVGKLIRYAEDHGCMIKDINAAELKKISPHLTDKAIRKVFK